MAKFVSGPMAMSVIVSGGFEERMERISVGAERSEGVKRRESVGGFVCVADVAVVVSRSSEGGAGGGGSKRCFHVSAGEL